MNYDTGTAASRPPHHGHETSSDLPDSTAQDTANAQSDIDLLVVLQGPFEHARELRRIVDLLYPVQLETERVISAKVPSPTIQMLCRAVVFGFEEGFSFAREAVDCLARRVERAQP